MSSERTFDVSPHRFFRAMVLMGSGIALGCGGVSDDSGDNAGAGGSSAQGGTGGGTDAGAPGDAATGGKGGTTGGTGTGGSTGGTTGGKGGTGGDISVTGGTGGDISATGGTGGTTGGTGTGGSSAGTTGGTGTSGTAGTGGTLDCLPSQWSCATVPMCDDADGYALPSNCKCDFTRPLSGLDCPSGRRACLEATKNMDGTPLSASVPFECACAPEPTDCMTSCHVVFPDGDGHRCSDVATKLLPNPLPEPDDILCGCSIVYLR